MRVNYQVLLSSKDPMPLIDAWKGGQAVLCGFTASHRILEIRLFKPHESKRLRIYCAEVSYLSAPTKWENADLSIDVVSKDEVILRDADAHVEIKAEQISADEVED